MCRLTLGHANQMLFSRVEHLCCVCLRSLQVKLIFEFLVGLTDCLQIAVFSQAVHQDSNSNRASW